MMWPARAAIRPVPPHAVVPRGAIDEVEHEFSSAADLEGQVDRAFNAMDDQQPAIARFVAREVDRVADETAQALGHFLGVAVHAAFVAAFGPRVRAVDEGAVELVRASLEYDEELRRASPDETLESDDVVAIAQPHLVGFVRQQLDAALDVDDEGEPPDVDLEAVAGVYHAILVEIMALSGAIEPPGGALKGVLMA
jgi:hypothetical protein